MKNGKQKNQLRHSLVHSSRADFKRPGRPLLATFQAGFLLRFDKFHEYTILLYDHWAHILVNQHCSSP